MYDRFHFAPLNENYFHYYTVFLEKSQINKKYFHFRVALAFAFCYIINVSNR